MRARSSIALLFAAGALLAAFPCAAQTQVTSTADSGTGSLRNALDNATANSAITFSLPTASTILLPAAPTPLSVTLGGIQVDGTGASQLTISGSDPADVIFQLDLDSAGDSLEIVDVNMSDGIVELDGVLVYTTNNDTTLDVEIRDLGAGTLGGALTKRGTATLLLDGTLSYTGDTKVEAGTLTLAPGTELPTATTADVTISSGATLEMEVPSAGATLNGDLNGAGTLELGGAGSPTLTLQGGGQFTGLLRLTDTAQVSDQGGIVRGNVELGNMGNALRLETSTTVSGDISGAGLLVVLAPGETVTLRGDNSHARTIVSQGTLLGDPQSLVGSVRVGTLLQIDGSGAFGATVENFFTGAGSVEKLSAGSIQVTTNQLYTGATTISGGTLELRADLDTTSLAVASGATLAGAGDASSAALDVSGVLAPAAAADPIGTITVMNATFQPGSRLRFDVRGAQADRLDASGSIDAANASLDLKLLAGDYSGAGQDVTLLSGTSVTPPTSPLPTFPFLIVTDVSVGGAFVLNLAADLANLVDLATTPNRRAIASNLQLQFDDAALNPGSAFDEVANNFVTLELADVEAVYDAVGGESHSAFQGAHLSASQRFERTIHRRARGRSWSGRRGWIDLERETLPESARRHVFSMAPLSDLPAIQEPLWGAWIEGWGVLGQLDGGDAADVDHRLAGLSVGFDAPLGPLRLGLAAGYGYASLELDDFEIETFAHSAHLAAYSGVAGELGYLNLTGRFLYARNHSEREIVIADLRRQADAEFDTLGGGVGVEGGIDLLRLGPALLQPVASFEWTRLEQASFDESGAGALDLDVDAETLDSLQTGLGLRLGASFRVDGGVEMVPELRARWLHDFGDVDRSVTSRFEGATVGGPFELEGAESSRDALLAGLGWSGVVSPNLRIDADYDVLYGSDRLDHRLTVGGQFTF